MKIVGEHWKYRGHSDSLTRRPDRLALLGGLKVLLDGFFKARLCNARGAPPLELYMISIIKSSGEEDGGEVDV